MADKVRGIDLIILVSGALTSIVALVIVAVLGFFGFNPMGFYLFFIVPVGALGVGLVAGSGYTIASRLRNVFIGTSTKCAIFAFGIIAYVIAHYLSYRIILLADSIPPSEFSFVDYWVYLCESLSFVSSDSPDDEGFVLGKWGYLVILAECVVFALGGLIPLAFLAGIPYCHQCQLYRKTLLTVYLNSEEMKDALKKQKKAAKTEIITNAATAILEVAENLQNEIDGKPLEHALKILETLSKENAKKAIANVIVVLKKCPTCESYTVTATLQNVTVDGQVNSTECFKIESP